MTTEARAPLTDEERKKRSTRVALGILAFSGGCGCLILVGSMGLGVILGIIESRAKPPIPIETPSDGGDEPPIELRLPQ